MKELTYAQSLSITERAIRRKVEMAARCEAGSAMQRGCLGTARTILAGWLRYVDASEDDVAQLVALIEREAARE